MNATPSTNNNTTIRPNPLQYNQSSDLHNHHSTTKAKDISPYPPRMHHKTNLAPDNSPLTAINPRFDDLFCHASNDSNRDGDGDRDRDRDSDSDSERGNNNRDRQAPSSLPQSRLHAADHHRHQQQQQQVLTSPRDTQQIHTNMPRQTKITNTNTAEAETAAPAGPPIAISTTETAAANLNNNKDITNEDNIDNIDNAKASSKPIMLLPPTPVPTLAVSATTPVSPGTTIAPNALSVNTLKRKRVALIPNTHKEQSEFEQKVQGVVDLHHQQQHHHHHLLLQPKEPGFLAPDDIETDQAGSLAALLTKTATAVGTPGATTNSAIADAIAKDTKHVDKDTLQKAVDLMQHCRSNGKKMTVRSTAAKFGISKSTLHRYLLKQLERNPKDDPAIFESPIKFGYRQEKSKVSSHSELSSSPSSESTRTLDPSEKKWSTNHDTAADSKYNLCFLLRQPSDEKDKTREIADPSEELEQQERSSSIPNHREVFNEESSLPVQSQKDHLQMQLSYFPGADNQRQKQPPHHHQLQGLSTSDVHSHNLSNSPSTLVPLPLPLPHHHHQQQYHHTPRRVLNFASLEPDSDPSSHKPLSQLTLLTKSQPSPPPQQQPSQLSPIYPPPEDHHYQHQHHQHQHQHQDRHHHLRPSASPALAHSLSSSRNNLSMVMEHIRLENDSVTPLHSYSKKIHPNNNSVMSVRIEGMEAQIQSLKELYNDILNRIQTLETELAIFKRTGT